MLVTKLNKLCCVYEYCTWYDWCFVSTMITYTALNQQYAFCDCYHANALVDIHFIDHECAFAGCVK